VDLGVWFQELRSPAIPKRRSDFFANIRSTRWACGGPRPRGSPGGHLGAACPKARKCCGGAPDPRVRQAERVVQGRACPRLFHRRDVCR